MINANGQNTELTVSEAARWAAELLTPVLMGDTASIQKTGKTIEVWFEDEDVNQRSRVLGEAEFSLDEKEQNLVYEIFCGVEAEYTRIVSDGYRLSYMAD